ncbi:VOC family protein [Williamsia herbipolensis]|uniref:VOC family protein n=1 Tax=Williamsia herbipolensis TaxID=1603258 RepID=UPI0005F7CFFA|nr:VOC family protein [Williamsia herbipolensis]MCX6471362.1 VOC family protein [Mycobacteriales bacterium]
MAVTSVRWLSVVLDFPADEFGDEVTFWRAIAGSTVSPPRGEKRQFASLEPFNGDPHLLVQRIDHGVGGVHLDLAVDDIVVSAAGAQEIGAAVVSWADDCITMTSPAGFVFCLVVWRGQSRKSRPIRWPGDTISIIDQVSIDIPSRRFDRECAFWEALTGWEVIGGSGGRPEFRHLARPEHLAVRILLQSTNSGAIAGHVDLASTHPAEEVARHEDWGAEVVAEHGDWTVMADPTGRPYCITARNPRTGELPG